MSRPSLRTPTEEEIDTALIEGAYEYEDQWRFHGSLKDRSPEEARGIVEACLRLGVVVTDTVTAQGCVALVRAIADLEQRVARLERGERSVAWYHGCGYVAYGTLPTPCPQCRQVGLWRTWPHKEGFS